MSTRQEHQRDLQWLHEGRKLILHLEQEGRKSFGNTSLDEATVIFQP